MTYSTIDGTIVDEHVDWHPDYEPSALARQRYGITKEELRRKYPDESMAFWRMQYEIFDAPTKRTGYTTIETRKRGTPAIDGWWSIGHG